MTHARSWYDPIRFFEAYYGDIAHLCSLLHAVALQHLRADSNLDNLESLGENQGRWSEKIWSTVLGKLQKKGFSEIHKDELWNELAHFFCFYFLKNRKGMLMWLMWLMTLGFGLAFFSGFSGSDIWSCLLVLMGARFNLSSLVSSGSILIWTVA